MRQDSRPIALTARGGATLLVIDDSEALRRGMCNMASETGLFDTVLTASDGLEGYRLMRQHDIDIVLCDLQMPRCDGLGFLRLQQRDSHTAHVPVIVLTASDDWQTKVKALDSGASDYLAKPAHPEETRARLSVHLKLKQLHDDLRHKTEELERMTRVDALTGVSNRHHLNELLDHECGRAARYRRPMSLVMVDIDHFKRLNDTHGHQAGDEALRRLGALLRAQVRAQDSAARYGGEEFAILLPETDVTSAKVVAERIRRAIAELEITFDGVAIPVTASLGVAGIATDGPVKATDLIADADAALYSAKRGGRNRVVCAPDHRQSESSSAESSPRSPRPLDRDASP